MKLTGNGIHRLAASVLSLALLTVAQSSSAVPISWVDWTSADSVSANGMVSGFNVSFSGNINPPAQTAGGTNFWAANSSIYTSPEVDNPPPDSDIIRLTGGAGTGTQTITFAQAVVDPVMAILSLGAACATTYNFDAAFDVLNFGAGHFGGGTLTELPGNILQGQEGHGIIQFSGTFNSISWTIPTAEFWHGFTVGIAGVATVPEPGMWWLFSLGLAGLIVYRRLGSDS